METMSVLLGFDDFETEKKQRRESGQEITVSAERADQLRERGLARKKPAPTRKTELRAEEAPNANDA